MNHTAHASAHAAVGLEVGICDDVVVGATYMEIEGPHVRGELLERGVGVVGEAVINAAPEVKHDV